MIKCNTETCLFFKDGCKLSEINISKGKCKSRIVLTEEQEKIIKEMYTNEEPKERKEKKKPRGSVNSKGQNSSETKTKSKAQEIRELYEEGLSIPEIIEKGYARTSVYEAIKKLKKRKLEEGAFERAFDILEEEEISD